MFSGGGGIGLMKHFGAEVACWAHNPKVVGSRPTSAMFSFWLLFLGHSACVVTECLMCCCRDGGKRTGSCGVVIY